ncbi:MAG: hypothetical protein M0Z32_02145 [Actinomycetota bacterium]|nr:hypothetical protein [Actinomycetota bacterium]MCL6093427.1 hypothetical protein [Actinomycetota bacterium]MDA8166540.1 hypothetical protein [Actinomycetota bacterium]
MEQIGIFIVHDFSVFNENLFKESFVIKSSDIIACCFVAKTALRGDFQRQIKNFSQLTKLSV